VLETSKEKIKWLFPSCLFTLSYGENPRSLKVKVFSISPLAFYPDYNFSISPFFSLENPELFIKRRLWLLARPEFFVLTLKLGGKALPDLF